MKHIDLIRKAIKCYPDSDFIGLPVETMSEEKLFKAAKENTFGDSLLSFIILELDNAEGDVGQALHYLDRAIEDLEAVRDGLYKEAK